MKKRAFNFAIQAFSTSSYFSKSLKFVKFLDKLEPLIKAHLLSTPYLKTVSLQISVISKQKLQNGTYR